MLSRAVRRSAPLGVRSFGTFGSGNIGSVDDALAYASANGAVSANVKFTDLHGQLQQCTIAMSEFRSILEDGMAFDGSSIRGWQGIEKSDMLLLCDLNTVFMDPFTKHPTVSCLASVVDPTEGNKPYAKDPRNVLQWAREHLKGSGIADHARVGPEAEFFVFDDVRYSAGEKNRAFYELDSIEGDWNTGRLEEGGNLAYKTKAKGGYFPSPPFDTLNDLRQDMVLQLEALGFDVEASHHEVATGGQCEIDFRFDEASPTADRVCLYKYVVRNVAAQAGKSVTFMPKPLYLDNGSGMHQHYSLHNEAGDNLFTGDGAAGMSEMGLNFIGGIMKHAPAILAFSNPTTNSYKRLVPGYEAPIFAAYSGRNRSAFIRIPISHPKGRRAEFRTPDPTCNPYLAFAAIIQAGIDGIKNKIDPGPPTDVNLYAMSAEEMAARGIKGVPSTLKEAIDALEADNDFLRAGGVFSDDLINTWIEMKNDEWTEFLLQPTPSEFANYYDA